MRPVPRMAMRSMGMRLDRAVHGGGDDAQRVHELGELLGKERLRAVGERLVGVGMDFDEQAVAAGGNRGARHGGNLVAAAGAVRGIADDGQVRELFDDGDGGDVHGVAGVGFEGADAALAEDDVVVAAGEEVFGGEQQLFDGGGDAALEQHGAADRRRARAAG